jgi:signal transduction histidine kinase
MLVYQGSPAVIGTLIDITDRVEEDIRIGKAVNKAQEDERVQIGMELHDNVNQILVASLISLSFVKSNLTKNTEFADKQLDNVNTYTNDAMDALRRLSHELAPSINVGETLKEKIVK